MSKKPYYYAVIANLLDNRFLYFKSYSKKDIEEALKEQKVTEYHILDPRSTPAKYTFYTDLTK